MAAEPEMDSERGAEELVAIAVRPEEPLASDPAV